MPDKPEKKQEPTNKRLWAQVVATAKTKFRVYPSQPASKWVHQEYVRRGGRFASSSTAEERRRKAKEGPSGRAQEKKEEHQTKREERKEEHGKAKAGVKAKEKEQEKRKAGSRR